ncbi:MAG TPA: GYD domain-containing protein [Nitrososphaerales archaeon]|nr:GYD domain-containing protein [Nitrososphaerales archaeon]
MWFITLVKLKQAPKPEEAAEMNKMMQDAATKMGVKIHQGFMTLGRYDMVWISEADDVSGPMRMSMMSADTASSETLVATSYEDAMKWMM